MRNFLLVAALAAAASADTASQERIRAAAGKSVALLQKVGARWYESESCVSCHHQTLPMMAFRIARERGVPYEERLVREDLRKGFRYFADLDLAIQNWDVIDPALFDALAVTAAFDSGLPPGVVTGAIVNRLASLQRPTGEWRTSDLRPPQASSPFTATAFTLRALQLLMPAPLAAERDRHVARALQWLQSTPLSSTEDRACQLLGLTWGSAPPSARAAAQRQLLAGQRPDGGWSMLPAFGSDAYSTGQVLFALAESGVEPADPRFARGVQYLLDTQAADGSWRVKSRMVPPAPVSPPYFESGFPYGHDQFLSAAGTAYAAMGLMKALPVASRQAPALVTELQPAAVPAWAETALFGSAAELRRLLDDGLSPNAATPGGSTLLMMAGASLDKVKLLVERGADVNARSAQKFTPLLSAASYGGAADTLSYLIANGAKVRIPDPKPRYNLSPLLMAMFAGDVPSVKLLLAAGADPGQRSLLLGRAQVRPMLLALAMGPPEVATRLIESGEPVNRADPDKMTYLHWASLAGQTGIARALLAKGASVAARDRWGMTPLHYAASFYHGRADVVEVLLQAGADPKARNRAGETPLALATKLGYEDLAKALRK